MNYDATWFYKEFVSSINWEEYSAAYKNDADFTPKVTKAIRKIVDSAGWTSQTEYFRIDVIGWESKWKDIKEVARNAGLKAHLWNMKIAVEHENSKADWSDELIKLMQVRCPLKVVISYNYYDDRLERERQKLAAAAELIRRVDSYESVKRDKEELLIILGNGCSKKTGKSDYTSFDYKGYLYDFSQSKFEELTIA